MLVTGAETWVDGRNYRYVEKAMAEADRASNLLSRALGGPVYVRPVLLFVGGRSLNVEGEPVAGLTVASDLDVCAFLTANPDYITAADVESLVVAASRPDVWAQRQEGPGPQSLKTAAAQAGQQPGTGPVRTHPVAGSTRSPTAPTAATAPPAGRRSVWRRLLGWGLGGVFVAAVGGGLVSQVGQTYDDAFPARSVPPPVAQSQETPETRFVRAVRAKYSSVTGQVEDRKLEALLGKVCARPADREAVRLALRVLDEPTRSQAANVARIAAQIGCPTG